jgi:hypothetical protein
MDWVAIAGIATAVGTLVLAGATFVAVRSAHESAHVTERALLASIRPVLLTPRLDDPKQYVRFAEGHGAKVDAGHAHVEASDTTIWLAFAVRNAGSGLAVLDTWGYRDLDVHDQTKPDTSDFRRIARDLYIPAGDAGFFQGAYRDPNEPGFDHLRDLIDNRRDFVVDMLYGDYEGGQRTISRFLLNPIDDERWFAQVVRHWNVDRDDPR